jgi:hypothetical protein
VATTASPIAAGKATAATRRSTCLAARKTAIPTSRFQPKWRLGKAAYWFVRPGGCSAR